MNEVNSTEARDQFDSLGHSSTDDFEAPGNSLAWFLLGTGVGALSVFLLDPISGERRRAFVRDKGTRYSSDIRDFIFRKVRDLSNRVKGMSAEVVHSRRRWEPVDDQTLEQRVRSEFGRKVSHAHSIRTEVSDGVVTLRGPVLASEVDDLIDCVEGVPGVKGIQNELDVHQSGEHIPGLQGKGKEYLQ
ncbi:MAG: BON domain-containing protein [Bdellovibrionales bacterium]